MKDAILLVVASSTLFVSATSLVLLTKPKPEPTLEVRVMRVTNTVYVPQPPQYTPVPMPMYPPSIHPVITNWIYSGKTNFISGLYTNGTTITNTLLYTNNTMRVVENGGAK